MDLDRAQLYKIATMIPMLILYPYHEILFKSIILYFYQFNFKTSKNRIYYFTDNYRMIIKSIILNTAFVGVWLPVELRIANQKYYSLKRKYLTIVEPFVIAVQIFFLYIIFHKFETKILLRIFYSVYLLHVFVQEPRKNLEVTQKYDKFTIEAIQTDFKAQVELVVGKLKEYTIQKNKAEFQKVKEDERNTINIIKPKNNVLNTVVSYLVEEDQVPIKQRMKTSQDLNVPSVFLPTLKPQKKESKLIRSKEQFNFQSQISNFISETKFGSIIIDSSIQTQSEYIFSHLDLQKLKNLCNYVCHASEGDTFGIVIGNLGPILQGYLLIHESIENYIKSLRSRFDGLIIKRFNIHDLINEPRRGLVFGDWIEAISVIETSLYRIVTEFYELIGRVEIEEQYVDRLQRFVDFNQ